MLDIHLNIYQLFAVHKNTKCLSIKMQLSIFIGLYENYKKTTTLKTESVVYYIDIKKIFFMYFSREYILDQ